MLRRRCSVVVTCDDGADSGYQFDDLANLMRLARIDFGAEFTVLPPSVAVTEFQRAGLHLGPKALACFAASPNDLDKERGASAHCAIAYRVTYQEFQNEPTLLLVVKPRLTKDAPLDLIQYQATHAAFPQESTLDQFFDEAQWESYRKLGALNGDGLFAR